MVGHHFSLVKSYLNGRKERGFCITLCVEPKNEPVTIVAIAKYHADTQSTIHTDARTKYTNLQDRDLHLMILAWCSLQLAVGLEWTHHRKSLFITVNSMEQKNWNIKGCNTTGGTEKWFSDMTILYSRWQVSSNLFWNVDVGSATTPVIHIRRSSRRQAPFSKHGA